MIYYAMTDDRSHVVDIRNSEQISNVNPDVWHVIENGGDYIKNLRDEHGICRYKLVDGVITERTAEEMAEDMPKPVPMPPSNAELAEAIAELAIAMYGGE